MLCTTLHQRWTRHCFLQPDQDFIMQCCHIFFIWLMLLFIYAYLFIEMLMTLWWCIYKNTFIFDFVPCFIGIGIASWTLGKQGLFLMFTSYSTSRIIWKNCIIWKKQQDIVLVFINLSSLFLKDFVGLCLNYVCREPVPRLYHPLRKKKLSSCLGFRAFNPAAAGPPRHPPA